MRATIIALVAVLLAATTLAKVNIVDQEITCGVCSADVCEKYACGASVPYLCSSGLEVGSCGTVNTWTNTSLCNSCCDVTSCPQIACPKCSASQCENVLCGSTVPFACIEGGSKGGCAASASAWSNPNLCQACCDSSSCAAPTPAPNAPTPPTPVNMTCGKCSEAECAATQCSSADPFECVAGTSTGGCGATPGAWSNPALCSKCCDINSCGPKPPAPTVKPTPAPTGKACGNCTVQQCESPLRCALASPFMCTSGSSKYGCSASDKYWPAMPETCDSCCDVSSCVKSCTTKCTAAQCKANTCSTFAPYLCTSGPLASGCSASPTYFPDQSQCFSCCDTASCN